MSGRPRPARMLWITAALAACFIGVQWGLRDAPLVWFAALRALVGGAALAVVVLVQRRPLPREWRTWGSLGLLGLVNVTLAYWAMFAGIAGASTGVAAVLSNAQPLLILLPAWWFYGERLSGRTALALLVGFGGLVIVALPGGGGSGALLSLLSAVAVTTGTLLVRHLHGADALVASAVYFLIGGAALAVIAVFTEGAPVIDWTPRFIGVLAFLGLVATAAASVAWFVETQRCALASLTAWMFLVPVFGLLLGVVVLAERPAGWTLVGLALVLLSMGVALIRTTPTAAGMPRHHPTQHHTDP
ncbi:MAG: EamA family transporter [Pseudonocardiales bacterium]|nr:MAG: EamA family transporter [Pseudonocardiales bacterium]